MRTITILPRRRWCLPMPHYLHLLSVKTPCSPPPDPSDLVDSEPDPDDSRDGSEGSPHDEQAPDSLQKQERGDVGAAAPAQTLLCAPLPILEIYWCSLKLRKILGLIGTSMAGSFRLALCMSPFRVLTVPPLSRSFIALILNRRALCSPLCRCLFDDQRQGSLRLSLRQQKWKMFPSLRKLRGKITVFKTRWLPRLCTHMASLIRTSRTRATLPELRLTCVQPLDLFLFSSSVTDLCLRGTCPKILSTLWTILLQGILFLCRLAVRRLSQIRCSLRIHVFSERKEPVLQ